MSTSRLVFAGLAVIVAIGLTGCFPHSTPAAVRTSSPSKPPSATPAPTPSPPGLPDDTLLRITATATATDGSVLDLVETASVPRAGNGSERASADANGCNGYDDLGPVLTGDRWVHIEVVSTLRSGPAWDNDMSTLTATGGNSQDREVWTGDIGGGQAECSFRVLTVPGVASAIAPVDANGAPGDRWSWSSASWGFEWEYEGDVPETLPFSFTSCALELGPMAQSAAPILSRQSGYPGGIVPCAFGEPFGSVN